MKPKLLLFLLMTAIQATGLCLDNSYTNNKLIEGTEIISIRCIDQDNRGRIWFGTLMNLYSYDGYDCKIHLGRDGSGNDHFFISSMACFGDSILLGCLDGVAFYDRLNESFTPILYLKDEEVQALVKDEDGIWIGGQSGLYRYRFDGGGFSKAGGKDWVRSMVKSGDLIYIGESHHLSRYNIRTGVYEQFTIDGFPSTIHGIDALCVQDNGHIYAGTSMGLFDITLTGGGGESRASLEI